MIPLWKRFSERGPDANKIGREYAETNLRAIPAVERNGPLGFGGTADGANRLKSIDDVLRRGCRAETNATAERCQNFIHNYSGDAFDNIHPSAEEQGHVGRSASFRTIRRIIKSVRIFHSPGSWRPSSSPESFRGRLRLRLLIESDMSSAEEPRVVAALGANDLRAARRDWKGSLRNLLAYVLIK